MELGVCQPMMAEEQLYIQPGTLKASHECQRVLSTMGDTRMQVRVSIHASTFMIASVLHSWPCNLAFQLGQWSPEG